MPAAASAQTLEQYVQQIAQLQTLINQLQGMTQQPSTNYVSQSSGSSIIYGQPSLILPFDIEPDMQSPVVSQLQQHLARDYSIYPEQLVTGLYGPLTIAAVKRFQIACGIVSSGDSVSTGFGRVGPLTRRALQVGCQNANVPYQIQQLPQQPVQPSIVPVQSQATISPTTGSIPLNVNVRVTMQACSGYQSFRVNYGDGATQELYSTASNASDCNQMYGLSGTHTYTSRGTYTVTLDQIGTNGSVQRKTLGTVSTSGSASNDSDASISFEMALAASTTVARGSTMNIEWHTTRAPADSAVRLELRKANGSPVGDAGIVKGLNTSGTYRWQVPLSTSSTNCDAGSGELCPNSIVDYELYRLRAYIYTPDGACWDLADDCSREWPTDIDDTNSEYFTIVPQNGGNLVTIDPSTLTGGGSLASGNLEISTATDGGQASARTTRFASSGKWYWEVQASVGSTGEGLLGLSTSGGSPVTTRWVGDAQASTGYTSPAWYGIAVDIGAGRMWFRKSDGSWEGGGNPADGTTPTATFTPSGSYGPSISVVRTTNNSAPGVAYYNFGQSKSGLTLRSDANGYFYFSPPTGFKAFTP